MKPEAKQALIHGAAQLGMDLDGGLVDRFALYLAELTTWRAKVNLTSIIDDLGVVQRHFLDSLTLAPVLDPARNLLDIGSGAGFPGLVLALVRPGLEVTLVEVRRKRANFLAHLRRLLDLENCRVIEARLGPGAAIDLEPGSFDLVCGRAVAGPGDFLELAASWAAPEGRVLLMLGGHGGREAPAPPSAPARGRWHGPELVLTSIPGTDLSRRLAIYRRLD